MHKPLKTLSGLILFTFVVMLGAESLDLNLSIQKYPKGVKFIGGGNGII